MKFNSRFWFAVIAISVSIIAIKSYTRQRGMPYTFERSYVPSNSFAVSPEPANAKIKNHNNILFTGDLLAEYRITSSDSSGSVADFIFYNLKDRSVTSAKNVKMRNIPDFFTNSSLFYTAGYELYRLDIPTRGERKIAMDSLKILKAFPIQADGSEMLLLGERQQEDGSFLTGFFKYKGSSSPIGLVLALEKNDKPHFCENFLIYAGNFSTSERHTSFSCNKLSRIFLFDSNGTSERTIKTAENVPKAEIASINEIYGYKRGRTFSTNLGSFIKNDTLFSFSMREDDPAGLTLDLYSLKGKYINSMSLSYKDKTNKNIYTVTQSGGKAYLHLDDEIARIDL